MSLISLLKKIFKKRKNTPKSPSQSEIARYADQIRQKQEDWVKDVIKGDTKKAFNPLAVFVPYNQKVSKTSGSFAEGSKFLSKFRPKKEEKLLPNLKPHKIIRQKSDKQIPSRGSSNISKVVNQPTPSIPLLGLPQSSELNQGIDQDEIAHQIKLSIIRKIPWQTVSAFRMYEEKAEEY